MLIIDKDDIKKYRFAVGKVAFLKCYPQYRLLENNSDGNDMRVRDLYTDEDFHFYIFQKPYNRINERNVVVWYEKRPRSNEKSDRLYTVLTLSSEFSETYKYDLSRALLYSTIYYSELIDSYKIFFENLLVDINSAHSLEGVLYKYYGDENINNNKYNLNDGHISFSKPTTFNDPFDCNCSFSDGTPMSNYFRVFCSAPTNDNILMWSYYSSNHKGYFF